MSVSAYEDDRRRVFGYGDPYQAAPSEYSRTSAASRGGAAPSRVRQSISRPAAKSISRPQAKAPVESGGFNIPTGVKNWATGVLGRMTEGGLQKNPQNRFEEAVAAARMEDMLAGMPGPFQGNVLSFLSQAKGAIGDGGLNEALDLIGNRKQNYQDQAKQGDARLAAMYDQLRNSILEDSGAIRDTTEGAREGMSEIASEEQEALTNAYQTTQGSQNEVLSRLGISDAANIAKAQGDVQGRSFEEAAERAATRNAAAQQYTTSVGQNAENFNTNNAAAAGMEGASRRADLGTQLASALAALEDEQAQARMQIGQANQDRALSLASQLYSQAANSHQSQLSNWMDRFNLTQGLDDKAYGRSMDAREMALREQAQMAEMAAANQQTGPAWNQLNPAQQFNQQLGQMAGPQQARIAQILGDRTNANGMFSASNALNDLQALGLDPYQANQYITMYKEAHGLR